MAVLTDGPLCACHGEPKRNNGRRKDGTVIWTCAVKKRQSQRHAQARYVRTELGKANYQRYARSERGRARTATYEKLPHRKLQSQLWELTRTRIRY